MFLIYLKELLESQFQRNGKFRAQILTMSADSLRSQPIGRDRLGHTYYFTQDADCNLRVYQEHLDEEIWQVVATTREELVNLISRLRGNEVVLPSTDIGVDEDTSSSNSCIAQVEKPPPPEEQDDSQEEEARIPNLRIKLSNNGKLAVTSPNTTATTTTTIQATKRCLDEVEKSSPRSEELNIIKKARPSLLDANRAKKPSRYEKTKSEEEEEGEEDEDEEDDVDEEELSIEEEDIDSAAAEEDENEEKEIEDSDGDSDEENEVGEAIEEPTLMVRGEGAGEDCEGVNTNNKFVLKTNFFDEVCDESYTDSIVGEVVEEATFYIYGEGSGAECLVGNGKNDVDTAPAAGTTTKTTAATTPTTPTKTNEPKATFFFGEPGCLKLSPIKQQAKDKDKDVDGDVENSQVVDKESEIVKDAANEKAEDRAEVVNNAEEVAKESSEQANSIDLNKEDAENSTKNREALDNKVIEETVTANGDDFECSKNALEKDAVEEQGKCAQNYDDKVNERKENVTVNDDSKKNEESVEKLPANKGELTENSVNEIKAEDQKEESGVEEGGVEAAKKQETLKENNLEDNQDEKEVVEVQIIAKLEQTENSDTSCVNDPNTGEISSNIEDKGIEDKGIEVPKSPSTAEDNEIKTTTDVVAEKVDTTDIANELTIEIKNCEVKGTVEIEQTKTEEPTNSVAEPATKRSEQAEAKNLPTTNISHEKPKPDLKNDKTNTLTATQSLTNDVTNAVSVASTSATTASTPHTAINRKRRLEDLTVPATHRLSTSESEVDIHSEQQDELATEDDLDPADVGAKRLKMRPKITNTDVRKKVEAQKGRVEETTSSSGEEDARRRRKIITPRRQIERCVKNLKVAHEAAAKRESSQAQTSKQAESAIVLAEEKSVALNLTSPTTMLAFPPVFTTVAATTTALPFVSATAPALPMPPPAPTFPLTPIPTAGRQKPTLAEIIEKKLKKTSEKAATSEVEIPTPLTTATTITTVAATTTNANDANSPLASFSPPKKSPITKPLKKNLLTQLRQEESDEDSIPRKRTISDASATAAAAATETAKKLETHCGEDKEQTPERKTPERKVNESTFTECTSVLRKTPDRKTPERQRKRRSSEEVKVTGANESESNKEMKYEALVEQEAKPEVVVKKEKSPSPAAAVVVGRRSSRRSAAAVIYAELPQPKRTRGGAKATTPAATPKKANIKEEKTSEAAKEVKAVADSVSADDCKAASSNNETLVENAIKETIATPTTTTKETVSPAKKSAGSTPIAKEVKTKAKPTPKASKATKKVAKKEAASSVKEEVT